jgi:hypothetical protein
MDKLGSFPNYLHEFFQILHANRGPLGIVQYAITYRTLDLDHYNMQEHIVRNVQFIAQKT